MNAYAKLIHIRIFILGQESVADDFHNFVIVLNRITIYGNLICAAYQNIFVNYNAAQVVKQLVHGHREFQQVVPVLNVKSYHIKASSLEFLMPFLCIITPAKIVSVVESSSNVQSHNSPREISESPLYTVFAAF